MISKLDDGCKPDAPSDAATICLFLSYGESFVGASSADQKIERERDGSLTGWWWW